MANSRNNRAFTFVEVLLTIVLLGIMGVLLVKMFNVGLDTYASITSRSLGVQQSRIALNRIVEELWRLRAGDLQMVADTQCNFRDTFGNMTDFHQGVQGSTPVLLRQTDLLARPIGYIDFDYTDGVGTTVTDPSAVRRINVELNTQSLGGYGAMTFRTELFPRSYMYQGFQ